MNRNWTLLIFCLFGLNSWAYCQDSSAVKPLGHQAHPKQLKSFVDTNTCIETEAKYWVEAGGIGGGNISQACPDHHPVLYVHNEKIYYLALGAGGTTSAKCCAIAYRWEDA